MFKSIFSPLWSIGPLQAVGYIDPRCRGPMAHIVLLIDYEKFSLLHKSDLCLNPYLALCRA